MPKQAIILAAGEGKRLRPFTETRPKCLVEVNGRSILTNSLLALSASGCQFVTIVVGHLADSIRQAFGDRFAGMELRYVENPDFGTTNSMYSLHLGLQTVTEATWVLEGDVFFEPAILATPTRGMIAWLADSRTRDVDGAYITRDAQGRAYALTIIRDTNTIQAMQCKSIGILRMEAESVARMKLWLEQGIQDGQQNVYYDTILGQHLAEMNITIADVAGRRWCEIDNEADLRQAQLLFGS